MTIFGVRFTGDPPRTAAAIGVCGVVMLPADIYWAIRRPADDFGAHAGNLVCPYPAAIAAGSAYFLVGTPLHTVRNLVESPRLEPARPVDEGRSI